MKEIFFSQSLLIEDRLFLWANEDPVNINGNDILMYIYIREMKSFSFKKFIILLEILQFPLARKVTTYFFRHVFQFTVRIVYV